MNVSDATGSGRGLISVTLGVVMAVNSSRCSCLSRPLRITELIDENASERAIFRAALGGRGWGPGTTVRERAYRRRATRNAPRMNGCTRQKYVYVPGRRF